MASASPAKELIQDATKGFHLLLTNDVNTAREVFAKAEHSPVHLIGLGIVDFMNALMSMETPLLEAAARSLAVAEAGAKREGKRERAIASTITTSGSERGRFPKGLEWDVLEADAGMLHGLTHALSESYMGFMNCLIAMNTAHSRYAKIAKQVFPGGIERYSPERSFTANATSTEKPSLPSPPPESVPRPNFLTRISSGLLATLETLPPVEFDESPLEGASEELIVAGTAFGVGLFGLVGSMLPSKIRNVVGYFGFESNRKAALHALLLSSKRDSDFHGVFSGLTLMSFYGNLFTICGYVADEKDLLKTYKGLADNIEKRYPGGTLWAWHRARIHRATYDTTAAVQALQFAIRPGRLQTFPQADALITYELAWTLLIARQYKTAAQTFYGLVKVNSWSHASYYFLAAGCHILAGDLDAAQTLLDGIPALLQKAKDMMLMGRKEVPTETFVRRKLVAWKVKMEQRCANRLVDVIGISPAHEMGLFWNIHARVTPDNAHDNIAAWSSLHPRISSKNGQEIPNGTSGAHSNELDAEELSIRSLLLGIAHRAIGDYKLARYFLTDAHARATTVNPPSTLWHWVGGITCVESAILELVETQSKSLVPNADWKITLKKAEERLDSALTLVVKCEMASRVESRIGMIRGQIQEKRDLLGNS